MNTSLIRNVVSYCMGGTQKKLQVCGNKSLFGLKEKEVSRHLECFIMACLVGGSPNVVHSSFAFRLGGGGGYVPRPSHLKRRKFANN